MLYELPAELIIMTFEYLPYPAVHELAWTNRRMMQIVRHNLPSALQPAISIKAIEITPIYEHNVSNKFTFS